MRSNFVSTFSMWRFLWFSIKFRQNSNKIQKRKLRLYTNCGFFVKGGTLILSIFYMNCYFWGYFCKHYSINTTQKRYIKQKILYKLVSRKQKIHKIHCQNPKKFHRFLLRHLPKPKNQKRAFYRCFKRNLILF